MVRRFLRRANSLLLAAAMAATLMPAQMAFAFEPDGIGGPGISLLLEEGRANNTAGTALDLASITQKEYTVIKGNTPVLPKKVALNGEASDPVDIEWAAWDTSLDAGKKHTITGKAGDTQIEVTVNVLPCDEEVENVTAMGRSDGSSQEKLEAIHPLKGYKGKFVAEYDIVPDNVKTTHDRAIIYLPETMNDGTALHAENCWDTGARLQFKYSYNEITYFQTQDGDGQVASNAKYYPTNDELTEALGNGREINALSFDETSTYRVRIEMDTTTDTTKGNYKIYVTDPEGIEHNVTKETGNGFRIYPKDGIIKNFAAVRGSYRMINHKISWISGYATKKVETYLKAQNNADYVKEAEDVVTKELPGTITEQPDTEIVKDNQNYILDTEKSGWYNGEQKVDSVTAEEGKTVTYRAYYNAAVTVDKTNLNDKIQKASSLKEEEYTAASWSAFTDALANANQVNADTAVSQEAVDKAVQSLDTAQGNLVSIKNLKDAIDKRKAELNEKEGQKADYANWDEVKNVVEQAEKVLNAPDATKAQVEAAEKNLDIKLIVKTPENPENPENPESPEKPKTVKVKSVSPAAKTYKIAAGKKLNLKTIFTVLPKNADNKKLTYSIDKKYSKYASIKSGVVTVKKAGAGKTVAVKATAADGSKKSATIKIKIMKNAVTKITVKKKTLTVKAGKKTTIKPTVTTNGKNANKTLAYTSSNEKLATVKNGVVTTKKGKTGKVTITIKSTDGTNKSVKVKINIKK